MTPTLSRSGRRFAALIAATSAAALLLQYVLLLQLTRDTVGPWLGTLRFFSYFTILSNLAVVAVTWTAFRKGDGWFARARIRGAVALYIGVTGIVYFLILRHLWQPQGWQWWADSGLHYAVPALYLLWWIAAVPHGALTLGDAAAWLLFPLAYCAYALLRGAWLGEYPYPFLDAAQLGYPRTLLNALGVTLGFLIVAGVLLMLDRLRATR